MFVLKKVVIAITGLALFTASSSLQAQIKFPVVVAFGDSLSDAGNKALCTNPPEVSGMHFSGTWVMQLATRCGTTLTPSKTGGTDFANAGAGAGSLVTQLQTYLATTGGTASPTALYTFSVGGNDIRAAMLHGKDGIETATTAADNCKKVIDKLASLGAKNIMWLNLPPTNHSPMSAGKLDTSHAVDAFNNQYTLDVAALRAAHPDLKLTTVDFHNFSMKSDPAAEGFVNTTQSWMAAPADVPYSKHSSNPDADKFVYFDGLHPTTHLAHLLALEAYKDLSAP